MRCLRDRVARLNCELVGALMHRIFLGLTHCLGAWGAGCWCTRRRGTTCRRTTPTGPPRPSRCERPRDAAGSSLSPAPAPPAFAAHQPNQQAGLSPPPHVVMAGASLSSLCARARRHGRAGRRSQSRETGRRGGEKKKPGERLRDGRREANKREPLACCCCPVAPLAAGRPAGRAAALAQKTTGRGAQQPQERRAGGRVARTAGEAPSSQLAAAGCLLGRRRRRRRRRGGCPDPVAPARCSLARWLLVAGVRPDAGSGGAAAASASQQAKRRGRRRALCPPIWRSCQQINADERRRRCRPDGAATDAPGGRHVLLTRLLL